MPQVSADDVVRYLRITGQFDTINRNVTMRAMACAAAAREGISVSDDELQQAADAFRSRQGLYKAGDTRAWLAMNRLTADDLEEFVGAELLIRKFKDSLARKTPPAEVVQRSPAAQAAVSEVIFMEWVEQEAARA